jgi:hypothetical protein
MLYALPLLWYDDLGNYYPSIDQAGPLTVVTSDGLHMLAYLEEGDMSAEMLTQVARSSHVLETELGYVAMNAADADRVEDDYHAKTVLPFEQAMIHIGVNRFNLTHVVTIAERVIPHIQSAAPETLPAVPVIQSRSCDPQLWTLAARHYFSRFAST